ncbi:MAG: hypothetical protein JSW58_16710 [Candidatus Latescibacterota bacterium]|nr:MAG: hypothetical protein JSW58_16710 [Candidatus Latescibacterota bacterium]
MRNRTCYAVLAVVSLLLYGCGGGYVAKYDIGLIDAERPTTAEEKYGRQIVKVIGEVGREISHFEDDLVEITWDATATEFGFELNNKSGEKIEILWDDGRYVDPNGADHRIVHSRVRLGDRDKPQKPTVVEAGGRVAETIRSADNIFYEQGINARWRQNPFFLEKANTSDELSQQAEQVIHKTIKVVLPFRTAGDVHEYVFVFQIKDVDITKAKGGADGSEE